MSFIKTRNFNGSYLRMKCRHPNPPPPPQPAHSLPEAEGASRTGVSWGFGSPPPPEGHGNCLQTQEQNPSFYCEVSTVPVSHRDAPTCLGDLKFTLNLNPAVASLKGPPAFTCIFTDTQQRGGGGRDQSGRVFLCDFHPGLSFLSTSLMIIARHLRYPDLSSRTMIPTLLQ